MNVSPSLSDWIEHVFDHPVNDPAWHWSPDAPTWEGPPESTVTFIADCLERSGGLLARFTDAQLNQGFWYLISCACSDFMFALVDPSVSLAERLRAIRSFLPLFEQVMAVRCSQHLSHLDEQPANPINSACYMWWDVLPISGEPDKPERAEFDREVLHLFPRLLAIPNDSCRESALHGVSEWQYYYPTVRTVVDEFLARTPGLRPELIAYARRARVGDVL